MTPGTARDDRYWTALIRAASRLAAVGSESQACAIVADALEEILGDVAVTVYLRREDARFHPVESRRDHPSVHGQAVGLGEGHVGWVAQHQQPLVVPDLEAPGYSGPNLLWPQDKRYRLPRSAITVPIVDGSRHTAAVIQAFAWQSGAFENSGALPVQMLGLSMLSTLDRLAVSRVLGRPTEFDKELRLPNDPRSGAELSRIRQSLYEFLARRALALAPDAVRSCVRIRDERRVAGKPRQLLRFIATEGEGWTDDIRSLIYWMDERSAATHAVKFGQPFLIRDAATEQHYRGIFPGVVTLYCLPMHVRGEVAGVLTLDAEKPEVFSESQKEELRNLVGQAMTALDHLALLEDKWLLEFDRELAVIEDVQRLCAFAAMEMKRIIGAKACSIFLNRPSSHGLKLAASTAQRPTPEPTYDIGFGLTGWIAEHRQIVRIQNTQDADELRNIDHSLRWENFWAEATDYPNADGDNPYMGAPLEAGGELVGVVCLSSKENAKAFEMTDEGLLVRMASRLALQVQNLWLAAEKDRRWRQLQESVKLGQKIASNLDLKEVCKTILTEGCTITGCKFGHIRRLDKNDNLVLVDAIGPRQRTILSSRKLGDGLSGRALDEGRPYFIPDIAEHHLRGQVLEFEDADSNEPPIHAMVSYPLIVESEKIGVLNLHSTERIDFDEQTQAVFADLAARSAVALRASLLYDSVKRALERVQEIGTQFAQTRELGPLLKQVLHEALEESGVEAGTFRLFDASRRKWILSAAFDSSQNDLSPNLEPELDFRDSEFLDDAFGGTTGQLAMAMLTLDSDDERFRRFKNVIRMPSHRDFLGGISSLTVVPVELNAKRLGVLVLLSRSSRISEAALRYIPVLASFAAVAIENAKLEEERQKKQHDEQLVLLAAVMDSYRHDLDGISLGVNKGIAALNWVAVSTSAVRLAATVQQVPELIALVRRGPGAALTKLKLTALINSVVATFIFSSVRAKPTPKLTPDCPDKVTGNEQLLKHVFRRVLENADRALGLVEPGTTLPNIEINLTFDPETNRVCVAVSDNGLGMDEDRRNHLFEPFQSSARSTGLGLYDAQAFVKYHGGEIKVDSELGLGTTLRIFLPVEGPQYA